ncbi:tRNA-uridine aminocarboxypropyltransferase [Thalassotalea sp. G2M2-11]|uniref:tRNA-uridine aminocarboxypropyltransferase n=1 Tax=Thalassotalea sp. G2M2-11 TaxID=2787627 RepID=UPI0019D1F443|nr:tRNA-uridine aminocarboxypropyltransferase [Thalassotalea sp. G2M2-11]
MSRPYCNSCHRPEVSCICHLMTRVNNDIEVVVLQHPSEVKQAKGTVTLLSQSLSLSHVFVGETFGSDPKLQQLLTKYHGKTALLYPSAQAKLIDGNYQASVDELDVRCLILLDGTWKKAYRLFMVNHFLQQLPHIVLADTFESRYQIRSTKKQGALSTLEACCHALSLLESAPAKYQQLLENFDKFNQLHLSYHSQN